MDQQKKQLIVFGYGLAVIFLILAARLWIKGGVFPAFLLAGAAVIFLLTTRFHLERLKPLYTQWMRVAHAIGAVITGIILFFVYLTLFSIIGILLRLLKKDLLDQKIMPQVKSYWKPREEETFDPKKYHRQW